jgi:8-oxo-dGTP pyrophosphatase MutT (NUDIX family)
MTPLLHEAVRSHEPADDEEAADLARLLRVLAGAPDPWSRAIPLHVTGSALVLHPPSRRVLLRWHAKQERWLQVGGHGDPGEDDPFAVALREAEEETALTDLRPWPECRLLQVAIVPVTAAGGEPAHEHADLRYLLATDRPDDVPPEVEGVPLRWCAVDEALALADAGLARLLHRASATFR